MEELTKWVVDELKNLKLVYNFVDYKFEILNGTFSCFIELDGEDIITYCKSNLNDKRFCERKTSKDITKVRLGNIIHYLIYETRELNTGIIKIGQRINEISELMDKYNIPLITVEKMFNDNMVNHDV